MQIGAKACKSCRSRQELSNEYFLAKIGFDTSENEPFNFLNFSSLQGFNFHRAVVSTGQTARQRGESTTMNRAALRSVEFRVSGITAGVDATESGLQ